MLACQGVVTKGIQWPGGLGTRHWEEAGGCVKTKPPLDGHWGQVPDPSLGMRAKQRTRSITVVRVSMLDERLDQL